MFQKSFSLFSTCHTTVRTLIHTPITNVKSVKQYNPLVSWREHPWNTLSILRNWSDERWAVCSMRDCLIDYKGEQLWKSPDVNLWPVYNIYSSVHTYMHMYSYSTHKHTQGCEKEREREISCMMWDSVSGSEHELSLCFLRSWITLNI